MPDAGEHVAILLDANMEAGCVLGAVYSEGDPPPISSMEKVHIRFGDGASFEYDRAAKALQVVLSEGGTFSLTAPAGGTITAPAGIVLDATDGGGTLKGDWRVTKSMTVDENITAGGKVADAVGAMQTMRSQYNDHKHKVTDPPPDTQMD